MNKSYWLTGLAIILLTAYWYTGCDTRDGAGTNRLLKITIPDKDSFNCTAGPCVWYHVDCSQYSIKQPTKYSCWATALAMLTSWKEKKQVAPRELLQRFDPRYLRIFDSAEITGITLENEISLYQSAGMDIMKQLNPSIKGWEEFLKEFGPLSVTIDASPPYGGTIHALLITGIFGRTDATNTKISYIDPLDGNEHLVDFSAFIKMYEAKYSVDWEIQIIHNKKM